MKERVADFIRRLGLGDEHPPSLGIAALSAAAILAMAVASVVPGDLWHSALLAPGL